MPHSKNAETKLVYWDRTIPYALRGVYQFCISPNETLHSPACFFFCSVSTYFLRFCVCGRVGRAPHSPSVLVVVYRSVLGRAIVWTSPYAYVVRGRNWTVCSLILVHCALHWQCTHWIALLDSLVIDGGASGARGVPYRTGGVEFYYII